VCAGDFQSIPGKRVLASYMKLRLAPGPTRIPFCVPNFEIKVKGSSNDARGSEPSNTKVLDFNGSKVRIVTQKRLFELHAIGEHITLGLI